MYLKFFIIIILFFSYILLFLLLASKKINLRIINNKNKKKIGVLGMKNKNNIGNNLVKFAMYILLKNYGFEPTMIGISNRKSNLNFLKKYVNLKVINTSFNEIKERDYNILMVNSDQTWNKYKFYLDVGFLKFAKNWKIPKFVYGASIGHDYWRFTKKFDRLAKILLKNFTGISVREKGSIYLVQKHLGIKPLFVLDPTFLINKKYYLDTIINFKKNITITDKFICVYQLDRNNIISDFIKYASEQLKYKIYYVYSYGKNYIENFIFAFNISKAVITDSYHGTVFSIIFNKPFISFINTKRGRGRFFSLNETFNLNNRIIFPKNDINHKINLLSIPLNINQKKLNMLKNISIEYLKKNLGITY